jgi:hypothetical protein
LCGHARSPFARRYPPQFCILAEGWGFVNVGVTWAAAIFVRGRCFGRS